MKDANYCCWVDENDLGLASSGKFLVEMVEGALLWEVMMESACC